MKPAPRLAPVLALAFALAFAPMTAGATAAAPPKVRALTALDDTRACTPLAAGGYAFATGGGLALVGKDGSTRTLTSLDGLPDTRVHAVVENPDGVWIGTEGGAALVVGGVVVRTIGSRPVHAVFASPSGAGGAYLGTWGDGVVRVADKSAVPSLLATSAPGKHVAAIAEHLGAVHVAYSDGPVTRLEGSRLVAVGGSPTHGQSLASVDGRLILGDVEGVFRLERLGGGAAGAVTSLASVDARGVAGEHALVVATYGSGLLVSAPGAAHGAALHAEPGVPRWVRGVAVRGASRCAATTEGAFVDEGSGWHKLPLGGPPSNDVTTLAPAPSGDRVLVGTFDHGAAIFEDGAFQTVRGLERDETVNVAVWQGEGASARLWLGTAHGLVEIDSRGAKGVVVRRIRAADGLPSSIVRSLLVLPEGDRILVGTEEGAAFVEGGRVIALPAAASSPPAKTPAAKKGARPGIDSPMHATWALARDAGGTIYLGTSTGLYYGNPADGVLARASVATSELTDDWVTALAVVPSGTRTDVLVGTYSGGVTRLTFDRAAATKPRASRAIPLGGGYINPAGLTVRGGDLLASTMDGLLVRSLADDSAAWQPRFDASSGRDVTATRIVGGTLWVASRRGIAVSQL